MNNSTRENLSTQNSSSLSEIQTNREQMLEDLQIPEEEIPVVKQVMEKLDEVKFSPRESTLRAIFHYSSHHEKETVH